MIRKMLLLFTLFVLMFCMVGCQTIAGIGGDIQWSAESTAELMEGE